MQEVYISEEVDTEYEQRIAERRRIARCENNQLNKTLKEDLNF